MTWSKRDSHFSRWDLKIANLGTTSPSGAVTGGKKALEKYWRVCFLKWSMRSLAFDLSVSLVISLDILTNIGGFTLLFITTLFWNKALSRLSMHLPMQVMEAMSSSLEVVYSKDMKQRQKGNNFLSDTSKSRKNISNRSTNNISDSKKKPHTKTLLRSTNVSYKLTVFLLNSSISWTFVLIRNPNCMLASRKADNWPSKWLEADEELTDSDIFKKFLLLGVNAKNFLVSFLYL